MPRNTQSNRGSNTRSRRSNNNNPEGYNQYNSGWMDSARERPVAAAGLAAAAVGASVFLWSRRNQISEQLSNLSDQIGEWSENMTSRGGSEEFEMAGSESSFSDSSSRGTSGASGTAGSQFSTSGNSGSGSGSGMSTSTGTGMGSATGFAAPTGAGGRKGKPSRG